jgi:hypothetical protein
VGTKFRGIPPTILRNISKIWAGFQNFAKCLRIFVSSWNHAMLWNFVSTLVSQFVCKAYTMFRLQLSINWFSWLRYLTLLKQFLEG